MRAQTRDQYAPESSTLQSGVLSPFAAYTFTYILLYLSGRKYTKLMINTVDLRRFAGIAHRHGPIGVHSHPATSGINGSDLHSEEYIAFSSRRTLPTLTKSLHCKRPRAKANPTEMRSIAISIILVGYIITIVKCEQFYEKSGALDLDGLATDIEKDNLVKRMERRAYTYVVGNTGNKRLPNYNFGLGKRAK